MESPETKQETKKDSVDLNEPSNVPIPRELSAFETIGDAWQLVDGAKWAILAPFLCIILVEFLALIVVAAGTGLLDTMGLSTGAVAGISFVFAIALGLVVIYFVMGFLAGITKVAIERGRGKLVYGKSGFQSFSRTIPVLLTSICFLFCLIPSLLFPWALQQIYFLVVIPFLYLSIPFAVDKINSPFDAIIHSSDAAKGNRLTLAGIYLMTAVITYLFSFAMHLLITIIILFFLMKVFSLVIILSIIALIACTWFFPFIAIVPGVVYHKLAD